LAHAIIYTVFPSTIVSLRGEHLGDPIYFSILTQMTVSFGDVIPSNAGRILAPMQVGVGIGLIVILLGRTIASLPALRERPITLAEGTPERSPDPTLVA
jgi:hypothetical protein